METPDIYEMPMMTFEEWADYVESTWRRMLNKKLGVDGTYTAMKIHMPMLAGCAHDAYEEYERAWHRRKNSKRYQKRKEAREAL